MNSNDAGNMIAVVKMNGTSKKNSTMMKRIFGAEKNLNARKNLYHLTCGRWNRRAKLNNESEMKK